jgi:adenylate cyclase
MTTQNAVDIPGTILVVEDCKVVRSKIMRMLKRMGHTVLGAENGQMCLDMLRKHDVDVVLLDIMMPKMNGYEALEIIRNDKGLCHIPVIVISSLNDVTSVVRSMELGADDYLFKPFESAFLKARINVGLQKKRLHDQERAYILDLLNERERSERLLLNVLPQSVADRLKRNEPVIADRFESATVLFADLVDFTADWDQRPPVAIVEVLSSIFSFFDLIAKQNCVEKIKTIGDAYMAVGGLVDADRHHAEAIADTALAMQAGIARFLKQDGSPYQLRIGIATGPVVAGVLGTSKFSYDVWGDTVNTASRMQYHGPADCIQVTQAAYECLKDAYLFEERGTIEVKGKGEMMTYLLTGSKNHTI